MWGSWNVALWAPSGHPGRCLIRISLILLRREWSKLDVQVVVCNWVGDPFKAWVAGSNPAALTIFFNRWRVRRFRQCPVTVRLIAVHRVAMRGGKAALGSFHFNYWRFLTGASFGMPSGAILQTPEKKGQTRRRYGAPGSPLTGRVAWLLRSTG